MTHWRLSSFQSVATSENVSCDIRHDILVTRRNYLFVVEVQREAQHFFYDRAVFNSTFSVQRQILKGSDNYRFEPVYFIGIMRFVIEEDDDRFLHRFSLTDDETGKQMTDDLHYIFLETPKCRLKSDSSLAEKLGYALYNLPSMVKRPKELTGEIFDLLFSSADLSNFAPEEKIKYQSDMTTERDIRNQIAYAKDKGIEQGIEQGIAQGAAQSKAEIAKAMLADGMDIALVVKYSGLSPEEIKSL